jgi:hypothetical protein
MQHVRLICIPVLSLLLSLVVAPPARATSRSSEVPKMRSLQHVDLVIYGEVLSESAAWEDSKIITRYRVRVLDSATGDDQGQEVVLRVLGGEVTQPFPVGMHVPGTPELDPGDKIFSLLGKNEDGSFHLASAGVLPVQQKADGPAVTLPQGKVLSLKKALKRVNDLEAALAKGQTRKQAPDRDR